MIIRSSSLESLLILRNILSILPTLILPFYIVPDVLEDAKGTISSWHKFFLNYGEDLKDRTAIGVVQGSTYQELVDCYKYMSDNADYIAISFDYKWYETGYYN